MDHTTEIVKQEQINDEAIAVTIRCCGESLTDSTRSIHVLQRQNGAVTPRAQADIDSDIDTHHNEVAAKHAGMVAAKAHVSSITQTTKQHSI